METQSPRTEMVTTNVIEDAKEIQKKIQTPTTYNSSEIVFPASKLLIESSGNLKASTQLTDWCNTCEVGCHNVDPIPTQALEIFLPWPSILKCFNK